MGGKCNGDVVFIWKNSSGTVPVPPKDKAEYCAFTKEGKIGFEIEFIIF